MEWFDCKTDLHPKALGFDRQYWLKPSGSQYELWRMKSGEYGISGDRVCTSDIDYCKDIAHTDNLQRVSKATIDKIRMEEGL